MSRHHNPNWGPANAQPGIGHALSPGVILNLIAVDAAQTKIGRLGMGKVKATGPHSRLHGEVFGQGDAGIIGASKENWG
jgi:hypothetical protein